MVDQSVLRDKLIAQSKGMFSQVQPTLYDIMGRFPVKVIGGSNLYDMSNFYSNPSVSVGDEYSYTYTQGKIETKPRRFQRFTSGVKLVESEAENLNGEELVAKIDTQIRDSQAIVDTAMIKNLVGYANEVDLLSAMNLQGTSGSSIADPADCCATPGTSDSLGAINFSGAGQTERNLEATLGVAIRGISTKTLNTTTGLNALKNNGSDSFDLWCHPNFANVLKTTHDLLDSGEHDPLTYEARLKTWNTTIRPTLALDSYSGATDATAVMVVTANTKENFFIAEAEQPKWTSWERLFDGKTINWVKNYKVGAGAFARGFINGSQPYKAMYSITTTPIGS